MNCDLHTHSIFSDGTFTPEEIVIEAKKTELKAIALTDHNTVMGLCDFMKAADKYDIVAIGGVELSTEFEHIEFHLLGLFIEPDYYDDVERLAKEFHVLKEISNIETIERLNEAGYMISYSDVRKKNPNGNVNRAHIASELLDKGYVESVSKAFATILSDNAGFYVPPARLQLIDAIEFIRSIKAIPILAHPLKDTDENNLRNILPCLIKSGLAGIEVYHSDYSQNQIDIAKKIAKDFNLLYSGGSDFHGNNKPNIKLGIGKGTLNVPEEAFKNLCNYYVDNLAHKKAQED